MLLARVARPFLIQMFGWWLDDGGDVERLAVAWVRIVERLRQMGDTIGDSV